MYIRYHLKYPSFFPDFNKNYTLFDQVSKNTQILNFMKIRPGGNRVVPCGQKEKTDVRSETQI